MPEEVNYYGLVNKPPIDEIYNLDLVNKPDILSDELSHYGILGMHWGIRRYQNPDGTLTDAGKRRLAKRQAKIEKAEAKRAKKREKYISNPDTKYFNKHLEKFTNDEIERAIKRMEWKKHIDELNRDKIHIGKDRVDTMLKYGDSVNNALKFLNSDAGKGIRQKLGMNTNTIFDFSGRERKAEESKKNEQDFRDWYRKEVAKRQLNNKYNNSAIDEDQKSFFEDEYVQEQFAEWKKKKQKGGKK